MDSSDGDLRELMLALVGTTVFTQRSLDGLAQPLQVPFAISDPVANRSTRLMVIDLVKAELDDLYRAFAPGEDRRLLDTHLSSLRDYERRLASP
jgi:hypothetical protein